MKLLTETKKQFKLLVNTTVIYCSSGGAAGSVILLDFSKDGSTIDYTTRILCDWRIMRNRIPIVSSSEPFEVGGPIGTIPNQLVGLKLQKIVINNVIDISFRFSNNYQLDVFSNQTPNSVYKYENWNFSVIEDNLNYELTKDYQIVKCKYDTSK
ncbi:MAG: hypothetical protein U0Y96_06855 [Candidatus Kapaibacterium sp.]